MDLDSCTEKPEAYEISLALRRRHRLTRARITQKVPRSRRKTRSGRLDGEENHLCRGPLAEHGGPEISLAKRPGAGVCFAPAEAV